MKITDVKPIHLRTTPMDQPCEWGYDAFLVRVYTDEGIVGTGASDTNPEVAKACVMAAESNFFSVGLRKLLIGENPLEIQRLWDKMYFSSTYYGRKSAAVHAISAIDIALWDIASQYYKVPIHTLLGGKYRDKIRVYATLPDMDSIEATCDKAIEMKEKGFTSLKLGIYGDTEYDIRKVAKLRECLGDQFELEIDNCSKWRTFGKAASMFRKLEQFNLNFIEEPVIADDFNGYKKLSSMTGAMIAGGENLTTRYEFKPFIEQAEPDIVQPDITRCGGISEIRRIHDIAQLHGCKIVPHDWSTPILISAAVQFLAATDDCDFFEYCMSESPIFTELAANKLPYKDGYVEVPDCIGLGLELDEDFIRRYEVK
ncbi:MAG: mandelate racemase/muconate lactonizing enzyme family protein [Faecousia sp.]